MTTNPMTKEQEEGVFDLGPRFNERQSALFEADILATEQYHRVYRRRLLSAEHCLMLAVLEEAIADFQRYIVARDSKGKKCFTEAEAWILDKDTDWTFSFVNICEVLGFDPEYLRHGLLRWKRERLAKRPNTPTGPRRKFQKGRFLSAA